MKRPPYLGLVGFLLLEPSLSSAEVITFEEQIVIDLLGSARWTANMPSFSLSGLDFIPRGTTSTDISPFVYLRSSFDDRSPAPSPYDYISGRLLQVGSTALQIDFAEPVAAFGFGAALNATSAPSSMLVELFSPADTSLGLFSVILNRTLLSVWGGTNSDSEGSFFVSGLPGISSVLITNYGDGVVSDSQYHWVIDNVVWMPVPEPSTLMLSGIGIFTLAAFSVHQRMTGAWKAGKAEQRTACRGGWQKGYGA